MHNIYNIKHVCLLAQKNWKIITTKEFDIEKTELQLSILQFTDGWKTKNKTNQPH